MLQYPKNDNKKYLAQWRHKSAEKGLLLPHINFNCSLALSEEEEKFLLTIQVHMALHCFSLLQKYSIYSSHFPLNFNKSTLTQYL